MPFVVDASIAACWALQDEHHSGADLALERIRVDEALVPSLWWFELRNILIMGERRKRITESETATFLRSVSRLPMRTDRLPDETVVLRLARTHKLSVYDASYVELAQREGVPLATLDSEMIKAARAENLTLIADS
jgi:predicted nucleic acid-binding protein